MAKFQIRVENSAPSQTQPAQSAEWAAKIFYDSGARRIVDLGCGRLRNLPVFMKYFNDITLVDTKFQFDRIRDIIPKSKNIIFLTLDEFAKSRTPYDGVFCISVLHIMPYVGTRRNLIKTSHSVLKNDGLILVDVPTHETYYARRCNEENQHLDGWVMGKGQYRTFYKNFTAKQIDDFIRKSASFQKIDANSQIKHVTRIFKKMT